MAVLKINYTPEWVEGTDYKGATIFSAQVPFDCKLIIEESGKRYHVGVYQKYEVYTSCYALSLEKAKEKALKLYIGYIRKEFGKLNKEIRNGK